MSRAIASSPPSRARTPHVASLCCAGIIALLAAPVARANDVSMPCEGGRVELGSNTIDVLGRCGRPAMATTEREEHGSKSTSPDHWEKTERRVSVVIDHWTYDFGSNRFLYLVTLEGGHVIRLEQGPYGTGSVPEGAQVPMIPRATCSPNSFRGGESAYELAARCGDPAVRDVREETRTEAVHPRPGVEDFVSRTFTTELWTYDLGPSQFVRFVLLEEGRVVKISTGGYGYSR